MITNDNIMKFAVDMAVKAGELLASRFGRVQNVSYKGKINLVTEMDKKSEDLILKSVKRKFPSHEVMSEEMFEGKTFKKSSSEYRWIVDPLDGTTNYAHGFPWFCISIALEHDGIVVLGVVYNPLNKELFTVQKGKGAFKNKKRIVVSATTEFHKSLLATGFPYDVHDKPGYILKDFSAFAVKARGVRRAGSAALDLCCIASGVFDGFWEQKLAPWDVAAGCLAVREAGGIVTDFSGKEHTIYTQATLASNSIIHSEMLKILKNNRKNGVSQS